MLDYVIVFGWDAAVSLLFLNQCLQMIVHTRTHTDPTRPNPNPTTLPRRRSPANGNYEIIHKETKNARDCDRILLRPPKIDACLLINSSGVCTQGYFLCFSVARRLSRSSTAHAPPQKKTPLKKYLRYNTHITHHASHIRQPYGYITERSILHKTHSP